MSDFLLFERQDAVVTLTLNSPQTRNVLTGNDAADAFVGACARINADESIRAVVLTGAGTAFSAGGDLKDMQRLFDRPQAELREWYRNGVQRLVRALYGVEVPVIAAVNGAAIGAGCDLAVLCDVRIASERARFAESFIKVGLIPGDGGAWLLQRVIGKSMAAELSFTGRIVDAQEALRIGLVSRVVSPDQLLPAASALAAEMAENPGSVLRHTKRLLRSGERVDFDHLLELSAAVQASLHSSAAHRDAVQAFVEKRKPPA